MHRPNFQLTIPECDGRTSEAKLLRECKATMQPRLDAAPSFEGWQAGNAVLRFQHEIAVLARTRTERGTLTEFEVEMLGRHENSLARALKRWERLVPQSRQLSLAEHLARRFTPTAA